MGSYRISCLARKTGRKRSKAKEIKRRLENARETERKDYTRTDEDKKALKVGNEITANDAAIKALYSSFSLFVFTLGYVKVTTSFPFSSPPHSQFSKTQFFYIRTFSSPSFRFSMIKLTKLNVGIRV